MVSSIAGHRWHLAAYHFLQFRSLLNCWWRAVLVSYARWFCKWLFTPASLHFIKTGFIVLPSLVMIVQAPKHFVWFIVEVTSLIVLWVMWLVGASIITVCSPIPSPLSLLLSSSTEQMARPRVVPRVLPDLSHTQQHHRFFVDQLGFSFLFDHRSFCRLERCRSGHDSSCPKGSFAAVYCPAGNYFRTRLTLSLPFFSLKSAVWSFLWI
jgi:hypothetical protein